MAAEPEDHPGVPAEELGLEARYEVKRLTSSQSGKTHDENCQYFVLDLTHDPIARSVAQDYAYQAKYRGRSRLAKELSLMLDKLEYEALREEAKGD